MFFRGVEGAAPYRCFFKPTNNPKCEDSTEWIEKKAETY